MILVDFLVLSLLLAPKPAEPSIYARFPNWLSPPLYKAIDCMIVYVITVWFYLKISTICFSIHAQEPQNKHRAKTFAHEPKELNEHCNTNEQIRTS